MNLFKAFFSLKRFKVKGKSMKPFLMEGDRLLAFTDKKSLENVVSGDVVIVKTSDGRELIKRVAECKEQKLFLLGDNSEESIDSREFGFLDKAGLIGKFWKKY